ncbi:MAG: (2Fe-2S)-binding protein [Oscillospiraceae bacterium]|nr:(2Fe-2S)-binding protein [Oscillospiraceae bacterium]
MKIVIDGKQIEAKNGATILQAAAENGISIPTLCYLAEENKISACRVCVVSVKGQPRPVPACSTAVREGMEIVTDSPELRADRRTALELICSDHNMDCTYCPRGHDCRLRELCRDYGADDHAFGAGRRDAKRDASTPWLVRDNSRCILCRRCEAVCRSVIGISAISAGHRAGRTEIGFTLPLNETECVGCGACAAVCPTGALTEQNNEKKAWKAIYDKTKFTAAIVSPNTYMSIGRMFGDAPDTPCGGKIAALLRKIGFDAVYDGGSFDPEIPENIFDEAAERPILIGECPAWKRYAERNFPEYEFISYAGGAECLARRLKCEKSDKRIFAVSFDNCIAKKDIESEAGVDLNLTTRELFWMLRRACVSSFTAGKIWDSTAPEAFDTLPESKKPSAPSLMPELYEFTVKHDGTDLKIAKISGLAAAKAVVLSGKYDILEVRACPGGCKNGGGGSPSGGDFPQACIKEAVVIANELLTEKHI